MTDLPFEEFESFISQYYPWIENIGQVIISYIEFNRLSMEQAKKIVDILIEKKQIDPSKMKDLIENCIHCTYVKENLINLYGPKPQQEKEWIVYYAGRDIGHRVKGNNYTQALLAAYEKYGGDGKITNVEEVK